MYGYNSRFSGIFRKGNNFHDFLTASLVDIALPKKTDSTLTGKNLFLLRVEPNDKGGINNMTCHRHRIARLTAPCPSHKKL